MVRTAGIRPTPGDDNRDSPTLDGFRHAFLPHACPTLTSARPHPPRIGPGQKAADDLPVLLTATGLVDKADKESLTVKPRGADGKFQKALVLKVTGTSKVAVLAPQKRGDKVVLTQREAEAKDLVAGQQVAIVYAEVGKDGAVLLTAVVHPAPTK